MLISCLLRPNEQHIKNIFSSSSYTSVVFLHFALCVIMLELVEAPQFSRPQTAFEQYLQQKKENYGAPRYVLKFDADILHEQRRPELPPTPAKNTRAKKEQTDDYDLSLLDPLPPVTGTSYDRRHGSATHEHARSRAPGPRTPGPRLEPSHSFPMPYTPVRSNVEQLRESLSVSRVSTSSGSTVNTPVELVSAVKSLAAVASALASHPDAVKGKVAKSYKKLALAAEELAATISSQTESQPATAERKLEATAAAAAARAPAASALPPQHRHPSLPQPCSHPKTRSPGRPPISKSNQAADAQLLSGSQQHTAYVAESGRAEQEEHTTLHAHARAAPFLDSMPDPTGIAPQSHGNEMYGGAKQHRRHSASARHAVDSRDPHAPTAGAPLYRAPSPLTPPVKALAPRDLRRWSSQSSRPNTMSGDHTAMPDRAEEPMRPLSRAVATPRYPPLPIPPALLTNTYPPPTPFRPPNDASNPITHTIDAPSVPAAAHTRPIPHANDDPGPPGPSRGDGRGPRPPSGWQPQWKGEGWRGRAAPWAGGSRGSGRSEMLSLDEGGRVYWREGEGNDGSGYEQDFEGCTGTSRYNETLHSLYERVLLKGVPRAVNVFKSFDRANNGRLGFEDFRQALQTLGVTPPEDDATLAAVLHDLTAATQPSAAVLQPAATSASDPTPALNYHNFLAALTLKQLPWKGMNPGPENRKQRGPSGRRPNRRSSHEASNGRSFQPSTSQQSAVVSRDTLLMDLRNFVTAVDPSGSGRLDLNRFRAAVAATSERHRLGFNEEDVKAMFQEASGGASTVEVEHFLKSFASGGASQLNSHPFSGSLDPVAEEC